MALHILIDLIRHNRRGFVKYLTETVIQPKWFPGASLHPPGGAKQ